ncbi:MAG TPA: hypothetical protein VMK16_15825 [Acidimicrobiales bacterium]|nr:hypothetical protein [Acidimicrobiales bacterium]
MYQAVHTMWLIPVLALSALAALEVSHALKRIQVDEVDREAALLVREQRVQQLAARLALAPLVVRFSRAGSLTNRLVLDVGGQEIDARCYHAPTQRIAVVTKLFYRPSVGWIIGIDGPNGPANLAAWLLDVHPSPNR